MTPQQRATCQAKKILRQINQSDYRNLKSKKLWKNRGHSKYIRFELAGAFRLVAVMRDGRILYHWVGTHEAYNNFLPKLRRRYF